MEDLNHEKIWHAVHQCSACGVHDGFCSPGECICIRGGTATDPESSISTQAAVTDRVLKNGDTIRSGGEYILSGNYTQRIIIDSTEPVTINIVGNVNYTVTGDGWYDMNTLLYVKKVPKLTINGTGATVTGQAGTFLYSDNRNNSLPEWKINVVGGTYTTQDITFYFSEGNASYTTKVSMEKVTATGALAVVIDYCDVEIANSDFYGTETDLEDYENTGVITVRDAEVTLNKVTATAVGENSELPAIGNEAGTITVNGGTYYSWINNSHYGPSKITLNNVTTQDGILNLGGELTINGGTHTCNGCVVYTESIYTSTATTWIHGGTFISSNTKNGSDNSTIGIYYGNCYIDETYGPTKIQNAASDSAAIYRKGGSVEINAGTVIAPNGSAIKTSRGCVTVNGGELRGKYGLYDEDGTYDDSDQPKINGGTISGTVADIYLGKETYYDSTVLIGRDYDQELTVLVENPSNGRKITVETPDADDGESSYVPYQKDLKLVSLNPGYTIGIGEQRYWDDQSSEYRCLVAQNTVTAQNATAKADLGEGEKTLTTSDLVECGKPVTITAKAPAAPADPDADSPDTVFANWKTDNDLPINGDATGSKVNGSAEHELTFTMPSEPVSVTAVDQYKITIKGGKKYDDTAENEDGTYYYYAKAGDTVQLAFAGENGSHWSWNTAELPDGVTVAADDAPAHFIMPANAVTIEASAESKPVIPRAYRVQVQLPADVAFAEDAAPVTVSVPDTTGTDEDPKPDRTSTTALGAEPEQLVTLKFDATTLPEGYTFGQWVVTQLLPEQTTVEVTADSDLEATFSMPASPVTVTFTVNAPVEPEPDPEPADDGGTGAVIAGALIGGTAYLLGTRAWLEGTYGYVPANRMELALGLWKRANCPAPVSTELYADIGQNDADAQAAARWCVEQGLLKDYHEQNDDGTETVTFKPGRYVARPYALTRWYQLEKLLDEQQAAQAETPAEAPAQISET